MKRLINKETEQFGGFDVGHVPGRHALIGVMLAACAFAGLFFGACASLTGMTATIAIACLVFVVLLAYVTVRPYL